MKYNKQPVSIANQVIKLKERGLQFKDESLAEKVLSRINCYRLRAYTFPFQNNIDTEHKFKDKIDFDTIIDLYKFDSNLRSLMFEAIEKVEIAFRTQIIDQFSMVHGSHWQTNPNLYKDVARFASHLEALNKEISCSEETFIRHYKAKYTDPSQPPSWMSLEVASMSILSKMYQNLKSGPEKEAVFKSFGLPNVKVMENWMFCFSTIRNICAHHGRLWNRRLSSLPLLPYNTQNIFFNKEEVKKIYPNKLYATLCCLRYILKEIEIESDFSEKVKILMGKCPLSQQKEMGFVLNWRKHSVWN